MIHLNELRNKLQTLLNAEGNPTDFLFDVQTVGYHWDTVLNNGEKRNVIRVFVSSLGGNFNPVRGLDQANYSIPITIYFPVRFKGEMLAVFDYVRSLFVGADVEIGVLSGHAISNVSIYQFGEIEERDFASFNEWANETFRLPIEVMEPYMSMNFSLYLSTLDSKFIWGNNLSATLSAKIATKTVSLHVPIGAEDVYIKALRYPPFDETATIGGVDRNLYAYIAEDGRILYNEAFSTDVLTKTPQGGYTSIGTVYASSSDSKESISLFFDQGSLQSVSQSSDQQRMASDYETAGRAYTTTTSQSFSAYAERGGLWDVLRYSSLNGYLTNLNCELTISAFGVSVSKPVYVASANWSVSKGNPVTVTFAFSKRYE